MSNPFCRGFIKNEERNAKIRKIVRKSLLCCRKRLIKRIKIKDETNMILTEGWRIAGKEKKSGDIENNSFPIKYINIAYKRDRIMAIIQSNFVFLHL